MEKRPGWTILKQIQNYVKMHNVNQIYLFIDENRETLYISRFKITKLNKLMM